MVLSFPTNPRRRPEPRSTSMDFAYDNDGIRLVRAVAVAAVAPGTGAPLPRRGQSGCWVELLGPSDRVLFHRVLHPPFGFDREIPGAPGKLPTRSPDADARGRFTVMIPDLPEALVLLVFASPLRPDATHLQASLQLELVRANASDPWSARL